MAKSDHTSDPTLAPFISTTFSPTGYLNATLPSLPTTASKTPMSSPLTTISSQTQTQITHLNTLLSRLSTTLTTLTDEILRISSRLAYEVELLRGEAITLCETLSPTSRLQADFSKFVPAGLQSPATHIADSPAQQHPSPGILTASDSTSQSRDPPSLARLRTLLHVRSRLQSVIHVFDIALAFPLPPSSSVTNALISVSAPTLSPQSQPTAAELRDDIATFLAEGDIDRAEFRVGELREVLGVWKGTAEEKVRTKFVEELERMVAEKRRDAGMEMGGRSGEVQKKAPGNGEGGPGFLRGFQRLREEMYLE